VLILLQVSGISSVFSEELRLLLITRAEYKPLPLDRNELRRLFLGMPVYRNGEKLIPLINKSEELCYQVFLQSVVGLSQKRYERSLISGLYRQGVVAPVVYEDKKNLLKDLSKKDRTISVMFDQGEGKEKAFNVVQEIWISDEP
jgi:hypothetical protein